MVELPNNLKTEDDFEPLELEIWFKHGLSTQIKDIYPEVLRLKRCQGHAFLAQWNVVLDLVSMTVLDPDVGQDAKDELIQHVEDIRGFYAGSGIDEGTAFSWWEQWRTVK